ncbi:ROK family transcriptional regulator [Bacillus sp. FJAT-18019]|nr:ROK family transcriptional regulator [Bacillus sp. FJAT-18019]
MSPGKTASHAIMKSQNQQKVLHLIYTEGPISRVELAQKSGLTQQTVTNIVNRLLQEDIVKQGEPVESLVGRKRVPLMVNSAEMYTIGIEISGKLIRGALYNFQYHRLVRLERRVNKFEHREHVLETVCSIIDEIIGQTPDTSRLKGIGICVHGLVDSHHGVILRPPGLGWTPLTIREPLESKYGFPVYVENDVNLLALNESMNGCLANSDHNITLMIDWGIGGAIMVDKQLVTGTNFVAGEFGHYKSFSGEDALLCHCGSMGCLTTIASESGLMRNFGIGLDLFEAKVRNQEPASLELYSKIAEALKMAIGNVITFLNPDHVMLTGKVMEAFADTLVPELQSSIPGMIPETCRKVNIIHQREMPEETELAASLVLRYVFAAPSIPGSL